jgi:hypothetical protein
MKRLLLATLIGSGLAFAGGPEAPAPKPAPAPAPHAKGASRPSIDPARVHLDQPGDGSVWARTEQYKARFAPEGATFIPFLGSRAPRNFPLTLTFESITAGGQPFLTAAPAAPERQGGAAVVYARGAVLERYDLRPDSMEQSFVLSALPAPGDLVVRMRVESEMTLVPAGPGAVDYVAPGWGTVRVSEAVAFDAAGRRAALEIVHEPGALELHVPATFLAGAVPPVTIDPVVRRIQVSGVVDDDFAPSVASDGSGWVVCYERAYSATDHDIWAEAYDYSGNLIAGSGDYIDYTTNYWYRPRAAYCLWSDRFFVVATVGLPNANNRAVWGRTRALSLPAMGSQILIAGGLTENRAWDADVGGDWLYDPLARFIVIFTQAGATGPSRILASVRDGHGNSANLLINVSNTTFSCFSPAISKTAGLPPAAGMAWNFAWLENSTFGYRVRSHQFDHAGNSTPEFTCGIGAGLANPCVSSVTADAGGVRTYMVVWENFALAGVLTDLEGAVCGNGARLAVANLSQLVNVSRNEDQIHPSVDSDGCRFVVAHAESYLQGTDYDIFVSTFHYAAGAIAVSERHVGLDTESWRSDRTAVAACPNLVPHRYLVVWTAEYGSANHDVFGAVYDGYSSLGGHQQITTGCGGLMLGATGIPALGMSVTYTLSAGPGVPYLFIGTPIPPAAICAGCSLGLFPGTAAVLPGVAVLPIQIPCVTELIGQSLAFQGARVGMAGGCPDPLTITWSHTIVTTVQ